MATTQKRTAKKKARVYIIGDSPLVDEFAELCASHGFAVTVQWNKSSPPNRHQSGSPRSGLSVKRSSTLPRDTLVALEVTNTDVLQKRKNLEKLDRALQAPAILLSSSVTVTASEQASWIRHPERLIGMSAFPTFTKEKLIECAVPPRTSKESLGRLQDFCIRLAKQISVVQDRIGLVLPRIVCMMINEAYFAVQDDVASPQDIDVAMELGANHPHGPIRWGSIIGLRHVQAVLQALQNDLREDRCRIAPLLKQAASMEIS